MKTARQLRSMTRHQLEDYAAKLQVDAERNLMKWSSGSPWNEIASAAVRLKEAMTIKMKVADR